MEEERRFESERGGEGEERIDRGRRSEMERGGEGENICAIWGR